MTERIERLLEYRNMYNSEMARVYKDLSQDVEKMRGEQRARNVFAAGESPVRGVRRMTPAAAAAAACAGNRTAATAVVTGDGGAGPETTEAGDRRKGAELADMQQQRTQVAAILAASTRAGVAVPSAPRDEDVYDL